MSSRGGRRASGSASDVRSSKRSDSSGAIRIDRSGAPPGRGRSPRRVGGSTARAPGARASAGGRARRGGGPGCGGRRPARPPDGRSRYSASMSCRAARSRSGWSAARASSSATSRGADPVRGRRRCASPRRRDGAPGAGRSPAQRRSRTRSPQGAFPARAPRASSSARWLPRRQRPVRRGVEQAFEPSQVEPVALDRSTYPGDWVSSARPSAPSVLRSCDTRTRSAAALRRGRLGAPELVDQAIGGDDLVGMQEEDRQQGYAASTREPGSACRRARPRAVRGAVRSTG